MTTRNWEAGPRPSLDTMYESSCDEEYTSSKLSHSEDEEAPSWGIFSKLLNVARSLVGNVSHTLSEPPKSSPAQWSNSLEEKLSGVRGAHISTLSTVHVGEEEPFLVFHIRVYSLSEQWFVYRCFSEFTTLHAANAALHRGVPSLPPTTRWPWQSSVDRDFAETEKAKLNRWLHLVLQDVCCHNELLLAFLSEKKNTPPPGVLQNDEPPPTSFNKTDCKEELSVESFQEISVLGNGGTGTVFKVSKKQTGELYAMKVMCKEGIIQRRAVQRVLAEHNILSKLEHPPFIAQLCYDFETCENLYFVMPYYGGGDLFARLQSEGRLSETVARFWAAELLLALEFLHLHDIIHRDIKAENVLIDDEGHIALIDFGMAKEEVLEGQMAFSLCGTPEYLAPEVLNRSGHGRSADWWSYGVLVYEMLQGLPPFYHPERSTMFQNIKSAELVFPQDIFQDSHAVSLLEQLLNRDPRLRPGIDSLKAHEWFAGHVEWAAFSWGAVSAPEGASPAQQRISSAINVPLEASNCNLSRRASIVFDEKKMPQDRDFHSGASDTDEDADMLIFEKGV